MVFRGYRIGLCHTPVARQILEEDVATFYFGYPRRSFLQIHNAAACDKEKNTAIWNSAKRIDCYKVFCLSKWKIIARSVQIGNESLLCFDPKKVELHSKFIAPPNDLAVLVDVRRMLICRPADLTFGSILYTELIQ